MYDLLLQKNIIPRYSVNENFSENFAKIFCLSVSLHPSLNISVISVKLHSCSFLHTDAILCCTLPLSTP
jgi:hypothetical protein